jgi:hypothetical protein
MKYSKKYKVKKTKISKKKRNNNFKNSKNSKPKTNNKHKTKSKTKKILNKMIGGTHTERKITVDRNHFYIDDISSHQIDNYYFKIICTMLINERLGTLIISSITEDFSEYYKFLVYASQSELDFRRLVYKKDNFTPYYKGYIDYVQQTLVDLRLQKIISDTNYATPFISNFGESNIYKLDVMSDEIKSFIDDQARKIDISPFNLNIKNPCGTKQKNDDIRPVEDIYIEVIHNLEEYSQVLENYFNIDTPQFLYNYKKDFMVESELVVYFYITVFTVNLIDKTNTENKFTLYFMIYDLCAFNNNLLYEDSATDVEIKYKFYQEYSHSYKENKVCRYRNYFAPISIVPYNREITMYGLPNHFIPTGNYTCKVLEYNKQCTKYENNLFIIGETGYTFIGDRYNNLFPFNIIKSSHIDILDRHMPEDMTQEDIDFFSTPPPPQAMVRHRPNEMTEEEIEAFNSTVDDESKKI